MTEAQLREILAEALTLFEEQAQEADDPIFFDSRSFEEAGILTANEGLLVRARDGSEFQLTIVSSR